MIEAESAFAGVAPEEFAALRGCVRDGGLEDGGTEALACVLERGCHASELPGVSGGLLLCVWAVEGSEVEGTDGEEFFAYECAEVRSLCVVITEVVHFFDALMWTQDALAELPCAMGRNAAD